MHDRSLAHLISQSCTHSGELSPEKLYEKLCSCAQICLLMTSTAAELQAWPHSPFHHLSQLSSQSSAHVRKDSEAQPLSRSPATNGSHSNPQEWASHLEQSLSQSSAQPNRS